MPRLDQADAGAAVFWDVSSGAKSNQFLLRFNTWTLPR